MTNQEAIEILTEMRDWNDYITQSDALQMAIDALEKKPAANSEDAISRQAAIRLAEQGQVQGFEWQFNQLVDLPSVSTEKTGRWIGHGEHCENLGVIPSGLGAYEWCSNCDCGIDVREWHRNNYNYCPNCGAKMEVEE